VTPAPARRNGCRSVMVRARPRPCPGRLHALVMTIPRLRFGLLGKSLHPQADGRAEGDVPLSGHVCLGDARPKLPPLRRAWAGPTCPWPDPRFHASACTRSMCVWLPGPGRDRDRAPAGAMPLPGQCHLCAWGLQANVARPPLPCQRREVPCPGLGFTWAWGKHGRRSHVALTMTSARLVCHFAYGLTCPWKDDGHWDKYKPLFKQAMCLPWPGSTDVACHRHHALTTNGPCPRSHGQCCFDA
jgi:hypothetical protein